MKKKLAVLLSLLSVATMTAFAAGCAEEGTSQSTPQTSVSVPDESEQPEVKVPALKLDKTELALDLYASATLTATFENAEESEVAWESSDESVVKVADGVVTAYKSGTATVTAKAGELSATCAVTVSATEAVPEFVNLVEEISLIKGAGETLDLTLEYNGEEFTMATVEVATEGDKISISEDNEVLGLAYGEQTITVTAKVGEEVVATATVTVTVEEFGQLIVDLPENKLEIKLGAEGYALSQIKAFLNVGEVENPEFTAVSENAEVADIQDGKICPVGVGETTVTVSFEGELNTYETTIYVTVIKEVINKEVNFYVKGSGAENSADLGNATVDLTETEIDLSTVSAVLCNGEEVTFSVDGTNLTLTNAPGGYQYYTLVTPFADYVIDGLVYGKAIATAEELLDWRTNAHTYLTYTVLENDIDLGGVALASEVIQSKGTLDGLGHTVSNFTYPADGGFVYYNYGTLKNLQFVNAVQDCTNASAHVKVGLLGNNNMGTFENILAKVVIKNLSSELDHWGAICYYLSNDSKINNTIVHIEAEGSVPNYVYGIYCSNEGSGTAVNANAISDAVSGIAGGTGATDCNFYTSEEAMAAMVDVSTWGGYWQVNEDDQAYMSDYSAAEKNVAVTANGKASVGATITFTATSYYPLTYALAEDVTGVTLSENNELVIGDETVAGSVIKVVVSSEQFPDWTKTIEFTVEKKATQIAGMFIAKGNGDKWSYDTGVASFDLTDKGVDLSAVTAVEIDGETFENYSVSGSTLTVTNAPGGDHVYTLKTETEDFSFTGCVYVNGISTVEELEAWRTSESCWYTVLLNDIDYKGATLTSKEEGGAANVLGTLDGRGYSISNFTVTKGFINRLFAAESAIKNVFFKNVTQDCSAWTGGVDYGVLGQWTNGTIENVYLQVHTTNVVKEHYGVLCFGMNGTDYPNAAIHNVVVEVTSDSTLFHYIMMEDHSLAAGNSSGIVGSYANGATESASNTSWGVHSGFHQQLSWMIAEEANDELLLFTSPYWVIDTNARTIDMKPLAEE